MSPGADCAPKSLPAPWAVVPEPPGSAQPHPPHSFCFAPLAPPAPCPGPGGRWESHVQAEYGRVRGKSEELRLGPEGNWRWCPGWPGAEHWSADPHLPHLSHPLLPRKRTQAFVGLGVGTGAAAARRSPAALPESCRVGSVLEKSPGSCQLPLDSTLAWPLHAAGLHAPLSWLPSPPAPGGAVRHHLCQLGIKDHCPAIDLTSLPSLSTRLLRDPLRTQTQPSKPTPACPQPGPEPHNKAPKLQRSPTAAQASNLLPQLPPHPQLPPQAPSSSLPSHPPSDASPPLPRH